MRAMRFALVALCAVFLAVQAAFAFDQAIIGQSDRALQEFRTELDRLTGQMRRPALSEKELIEARSALEKLRTTATERSLKLAAPLAEINQQIASLGQAPAGAQAKMLSWRRRARTSPPRATASRASSRSST